MLFKILLLGSILLIIHRVLKVTSTKNKKTVFESKPNNKDVFEAEYEVVDDEK